jgi:uncharacterized protein YaaW (UPF0174 family)
MAYRTDEDLEFLGKLKSTDLKSLVDIITGNTKDEAAKWSDKITKKITNKVTNKVTQFSSSLLRHDEYKQHYPNHNKYWQLIAKEVQFFGANSIVSHFRGTGVKYREILTNVCDKMKVKYNKKSKITYIEEDLLMKVLEQAVEKMNQEDLAKIANELGIKNKVGITKSTVLAGCQFIFKAGGFKSYMLLVTIANATSKALLGYGLSFATNAGLTKTASILSGPIGWGITGTWATIDITNPAYRITVPAVIIIAVLRIQYYYEKYKFDMIRLY